MILMSCVDGSYKKSKIFSSEWVKYLNTILVWIVHLSCVLRSYNQPDSFDSISAKYFNRILRWIIHLSCVRRSYKHLRIFASNWGTNLYRISYKLFISPLFSDHIIRCKHSLRSDEYISMEGWYDSFICRVFFDHIINSIALIQFQLNFWIEY